MKRIVAIVVTYNRLEMLKECIEALLKQSQPCDILVVNNASTDDTEKYVLEISNIYKNISYHNTGKNLGGAGGFHIGIKLAVESGYDYVWIMDDDCISKVNTLKNFVIADEKLKGKYGFLSSKVLWKDNGICKMNIQRASMYRNNKDFTSEIVPIVMASFVSLFIKAEIIKKVGLPIKEFFIWTDDWEYTRRISLENKCYLVNNSEVIHKSVSNIGADISTDDVSRLGRYLYLYRNDVYLYRREGISGFIYEFLRLSFHTWKILLKANGNKKIRLYNILKGTCNGFYFHPDIEYIDKCRN